MLLLNCELNLVFYVFYAVLYSVLIIISILIAVAYFTLLDRKVMGAMHRRKGPNIVGF
jgi:NADH-quinone oxidoreductase subunit H